MVRLKLQNQRAIGTRTQTALFHFCFFFGRDSPAIMYKELPFVGSSLNTTPAVFTHASEYYVPNNSKIVVASGNIVKVYDGDVVVASLEMDKQKSFVASIQMNPHNKAQLFVAHENGCIALWDYKQALFLKSWETETELLKIIISSKDKSRIFFATRPEEYESQGKTSIRSHINELNITKSSIRVIHSIEKFPIIDLAETCDGRLMVVTKKTYVSINPAQNQNKATRYAFHNPVLITNSTFALWQYTQHKISSLLEKVREELLSYTLILQIMNLLLKSNQKEICTGTLTELKHLHLQPTVFIFYLGGRKLC